MRSLLALRLAGIAAALLLGAPTVSAQETSTTLVAKGNLVAPQFSSDGSRLLITGERMHGIGEVTIESGDVHWHLDEARVGVHSRYLSDGSIGFRARRSGSLRNLRLDERGNISDDSSPQASAFAHGDRIYLRTASGVESVATGDRFFAPILSPNGRKIAFTGLATGVHVYDIDSKKQVHVGVGTAPAWAPDGKSLIFERTEDDGHSIVGSDLWIWREGEGARALVHTPRLIERRPSFSPDGKRIAFDDDRGAVYILSVDTMGRPAK